MTNEKGGKKSITIKIMTTDKMTSKDYEEQQYGLQKSKFEN